jgi:hypothetical protein
MDKFAFWPKSVARLLIVGLLAWALVLPGLAASVLAHALGEGVISANFDHCAESSGTDGPRREPGTHLSCSCCIPCRFGQIDGPTGLLSVLPKDDDLSIWAVAAVPIGTFSIVGTSSPEGWISSWSQRAPPFSVVLQIFVYGGDASV